MMVVLIIIGILIVSFIFIIGIYNKLVKLRNYVRNALSQIDVQLTRRYELIPNLVEVAKKVMTHERETLEAVIHARNMAMGAQKKINGNPENTEAIKELQNAETQLTGQVGRMMFLMENYPDLKANQNMNTLMEELTSTENKVSFSRQAYNDSVMNYNTTLETFPNNIIAGIFSFKVFEFFKVENVEAKNPVKVSF